jgi:glycosyltransferase involved in cell wall biosynthesis
MALGAEGQNMTLPCPQLSIVIPAYNEEARLPRTLKRIQSWLDYRKLSAEVIVVDDGSTDATARLVTERQPPWPELKLVANPGNRGKGYSVRHGTLEARGDIVLFTDADLSAPIEEADKVLSALQTHDFAIGSRALNRKLIAVHESPFREFAGIVFNYIVRLVLWLPFADTQCGFKAFTRPAAQTVFQLQTIERWGFDPEILFIALKCGYRVVEVPVSWAHDERTRMSYLKDGIKMLEEIATIRWNALRGRYGKPTEPIHRATLEKR